MCCSEEAELTLRRIFFFLLLDLGAPHTDLSCRRRNYIDGYAFRRTSVRIPWLETPFQRVTGALHQAKDTWRFRFNRAGLLLRNHNWKLDTQPWSNERPLVL